MRDQNEDITRLEDDLKALKVAYEKYFAGIERIEPAKERAKLKAELRQLQTQQKSNTARRFRAQSLQASLITHENYWNRVTRQIEEGTYRRDLARLQRRQAAPPEPPPAPPNEAANQEERSRDNAATSPKNGKASQSYSESLRRLHQAYVQAQRQVGQKQQVSIDALAATLKKQMSAIKARYKCERVEFKVAVKDGKAVLKAIPR